MGLYHMDAHHRPLWAVVMSQWAVMLADELCYTNPGNTCKLCYNPLAFGGIPPGLSASTSLGLLITGIKFHFYIHGMSAPLTYVKYWS